MARGTADRLVVAVEPYEGNELRIVRVSAREVTFSTGEMTICRFAGLRALAEQLAQEGVAVTARLWPTKAGMELIEVRRVEGL